MSVSHASRRPHWIVGALLVSTAALLWLGGGCPPVDTTNTTTDTSTNTTGDTSNTGTTQNNGTTSDTTTNGTGTSTTGDSTNNGTSNGSTTGNGTTDGSGTNNGSNNSNGSGDNGSGNNGGSTPTAAPSSFALTEIAKSGDAVPGQASGVTFSQFGVPVSDGDGHVAFWALYSGSGAVGYGGIYVWNGTALVKAVDDDPASAGIVPGQTGDYFGPYGGSGDSPLVNEMVWGGGGRLLFISAVNGGKNSRGIYRWKLADGSFARVADLEEVEPLFEDAKTGAFNPGFLLPSVSDAGIATFTADYAYFTNPPGAEYFHGTALFTSNGTAVSILADPHHSQLTPGGVPDQGADVYFSNIMPLSTMSAAGDVLFEASYLGGNGSRGMYISRSGTNYRVIDNRPSASWPGLPANAQVNATSRVTSAAIGQAGNIALGTTLTSGGSTRDVVIVWDYTLNAWTDLTASSGASAKLISGVTDNGTCLIVSNSNPYLASLTGLTQLNTTLPSELAGVSITWGDSGGAMNNQERAVIPYLRTGSTSAKGLLYWNGSQLIRVADVGGNVPAGATNIQTVTGTQRDRPGRSGILSDNDVITFWAAKTGPTYSIYIATGQ